jgi:hypothetical protein
MLTVTALLYAASTALASTFPAVAPLGAWLVYRIIR